MTLQGQFCQFSLFECLVLFPNRPFSSSFSFHSLCFSSSPYLTKTKHGHHSLTTNITLSSWFHWLTPQFPTPSQPPRLLSSPDHPKYSRKPVTRMASLRSSFRSLALLSSPDHPKYSQKPITRMASLRSTFCSLAPLLSTTNQPS